MARPSRPNTGSRRCLTTSPSIAWSISRSYAGASSATIRSSQSQEVGLGQFEGRGWRGFHHHATLCIAAYGFARARDGCEIPPCGPRAARFIPAAVLSLEMDTAHDQSHRKRVCDGPHRWYRPRGSAAAARASHPQLNRNHAPPPDCRLASGLCRDALAAQHKWQDTRDRGFYDAVRLTRFLRVSVATLGLDVEPQQVVPR